MPIAIRRRSSQKAKRSFGNTTSALQDDGHPAFSLDAINFTTEGASWYLWEAHAIRRAPATLASMRVRGGGPCYQKDGDTKNGAVTYRRVDLDAWANNRLRFRKNTAEA
jgi:hypothetical protein